MTQPANPLLHTPAHKQVDPAKVPAQTPARNVWVQAVKQDKEQVK